jgi:hypothetical protein
MNSMKKIVGLVLLMFTLQLAFGQKMKPTSKAKLNIKGRDISKSDLATLVKIEDTLTLLSEKFSFDSILDKRKKACYAFIPKFVQALKVENSFYYPFRFAGKRKPYLPIRQFISHFHLAIGVA